MNYSPKLKTAMERIKAILKEYDIAASVVLHTPGFNEYLLKIDPTYSCAKFEGDQLRIKAKLQDDFGGDKIAWNKKVSDTVNMIDGLGDISGRTALQLFETMDMLKKYVEIDKKGGNHTSHTTQNN